MIRNKILKEIFFASNIIQLMHDFMNLNVSLYMEAQSNFQSYLDRASRPGQLQRALLKISSWNLMKI